ncbi:hypothetical protein T459_19259 [Capsicum annuum]|uniref:histidine kinase n=1 Tax=Capsicum annuum TaxID=4072 RepID=A0A2G2Z140_CAPAN|nr:hypothetical protein T459_19259 [Capsicum annuum]
MNTTKGPMLMMAIDYEGPVIRAGAECLQMEYGDRFPPSQEVHIENAKLGNQVYYIDSFFLQLRRLPMVGVIIIPRKHIMGKEYERAIKTLSRADKPVRCKTKSGGIKKLQKPISNEHENLVLEETEFDLTRELEGLVDMFSVQCINHNVETVLDLSGTSTVLLTTIERDRELKLGVEFEICHIVF